MMANKVRIPAIMIILFVMVVLFVLGIIIGFVINSGFSEDCAEVESEQIDEKVYFYCEADCLHIIGEGELIEVENAKP